MKRQVYLPIIITASLLLLGAGCNPLAKITNTNSKANSNATTNSAKTTNVSTTNAIEIEDETEQVTNDVYGEDLENVDRYPDSLRSYYSTSDLETDVTYQTTASQEDVRKFFSDQLINKGWKNSETATDYMEFTKGDDDNPEYITVYLTPYSNFLEYELVYEPAYTEEQLQELQAEEDSANDDTNQ